MSSVSVANFSEIICKCNTIFRLFYYVTALLIGEIIYRFVDVIVEYFKYGSHYGTKNRLYNLIRVAVFFQKKRLPIFIFFYLLLLIFFLIKDPGFVENISTNFLLSLAYLLLRMVHIHDTLLNQAKWIRSGSGIDYASGMASNYFNGYIRLQLPDKGDDKKGIKERCEEYESSEGVKFATKKLVILIPDSLVTRPKIVSELLQSAKPLETVMKNRAGVRRPFKNDVYKLNVPIDGKFYYIVLEGATPLLSFYESCELGVTSRPEMKMMQREILFQFYRSIKDYCSKCPETQNEVDFIYYNDYDINGRQVDVGEIVKHFVIENFKKSN